MLLMPMNEAQKRAFNFSSYNPSLILDSCLIFKGKDVYYIKYSHDFTPSSPIPLIPPIPPIPPSFLQNFSLFPKLYVNLPLPRKIGKQMIDPATVKRILETAQIVDVVSDFVTLHKAGAN